MRRIGRFRLLRRLVRLITAYYPNASNADAAAAAAAPESCPYNGTPPRSLGNNYQIRQICHTTPVFSFNKISRLLKPS